MILYITPPVVVRVVVVAETAPNLLRVKEVAPIPAVTAEIATAINSSYNRVLYAE